MHARLNSLRLNLLIHIICSAPNSRIKLPPCYVKRTEHVSTYQLVGVLESELSFREVADQTATDSPLEWSPDVPLDFSRLTIETGPGPIAYLLEDTFPDKLG